MVKLRAGFVIAIDLLISAAYLILSQFNGTAVADRVNGMAFSLFPLVGGILLARHPRNPVGYIISVLGLSVMGASTLLEYALLPTHNPGLILPLSHEAAWLSLLLWTMVLPCLVLILLLFPDGRLPGPRWKRLIQFTAIITLPVFLASVVIGWRNRGLIASMEAGNIPRNAEMINLFRAYDIWNLVIIGVIILALISFFMRFSRSQGIERQQLKWFVYGMSTIPVSMVLEQLVNLFESPVLQGINATLNIVSIVAFPVVMMIAITRYRLYDIDFIIRRTLLYSALTLTLGLIYLGVVLVAQSLFTWQFGEQPALMVVFTTLLIAALFQPLRRRFQLIIDRRFYRSKYNAEQTLQRFAAHLQNEVDLEEIERYLIAIVEENIQPEHSAVWLLKK